MPTNLEIEHDGSLKLMWMQSELSNKCNFVADLSKILHFYIPSIERVEYEAWIKVLENGSIDLREYIIMHYKGGGISPRNANINSLSANFREIGNLLDGGYYKEVDDYKSLEENGYTKYVYQVDKDEV